MQVTSSDDVTVELHDLGGTGPAVLIAHATGFCAGAYQPFAARLAGHGLHVWALDFRAHGATAPPADGDLSWSGMTDDVLAVADAIGTGPLFAYGHSMGGACLAAAELRRSGTLARAVLFEPIIVPPGFDAPGGNPLAAAARRRRDTFASRAAALARYAGRPPLGAFRADALSAYVEHGFVDQPDGSVTLACTPEHEASTFEAGAKPRIDQMGSVATPIVVACGERDRGPGPADFAPMVADAFAHGTLRRYAHVGHFGPFQDPDTLADDAAAFFLG
jgi:alpha-beta hydrolase superfamily lysophospholipase